LNICLHRVYFQNKEHRLTCEKMLDIFNRPPSVLSPRPVARGRSVLGQLAAQHLQCGYHRQREYIRRHPSEAINYKYCM